MVIAVLGACLGAVPAMATPQDAYNDFTSGNDQVFNQPHSWADLRGALELVRIQKADDPAFQLQMADAVEEQIYHRFLGLENAPDGTLDQPVLPPWMIAVGTASTILVLAGIAAGIWRRVRPLR